MSRFYATLVHGKKWVVEPTMVDTADDDAVIDAAPLVRFNLALGPDPSPLTMEPIVEEDIPCLIKASVAPVRTDAFLELGHEYEGLEAALREMSWPAILNRGQLVKVSVRQAYAASVKMLPIYLKVVGLVGEKNRLVEYGRFLQSECALSLLCSGWPSQACGSGLPPSLIADEIMSFNTRARTRLADILTVKSNKLTTLLLSGPLGFGKRTALRGAAAQAGLNIYHPRGETPNEYEENVAMLAEYYPCGLVVRLEDYPRALKVLRRGSYSDSIFLIAVADGLYVKTDQGFHHVIDFQGPTMKDRELFLLKVLPSELVQGCLSQVTGFSVADLMRLKKLVFIQERLKKTLTEFDLSSLIKNIRSSKSGHQGQVPRVTWDQVAGLAEAKELIRDTLHFPINRPDELDPRLGRRTGILLYGPPGSGKTLLAKALATEYQMSFLAVKGPELMSMYIGETESNIRELFAQARLSQPSILFFDELDSLATARGQDGDSGGVTDRIVAQLMVELDRISEDASSNVFVIGATNRPDLLDPALMRPGRLDKSIYLGAPSSTAEQVAILRASSLGMRLADDVQFEGLKLSPDYSPADLANICRVAMRLALKQKIKDLEAGADATDLVVSVGQKDFVEALQHVKPSLVGYKHQ